MATGNSAKFQRSGGLCFAMGNSPYAQTIGQALEMLCETTKILATVQIGSTELSQGWGFIPGDPALIEVTVFADGSKILLELDKTKIEDDPSQHGHKRYVGTLGLASAIYVR